MDRTPEKPESKSKTKAEQRLASALRDNLQKRKAQQRARKPSGLQTDAAESADNEAIVKI